MIVVDDGLRRLLVHRDARSNPVPDENTGRLVTLAAVEDGSALTAGAWVWRRQATKDGWRAMVARPAPA